MPRVGSSRWSPTPEQLMILEELYTRGLRTPNSSQIQQIATHLSFYGRIEGKNVFYWFQNHKARDRQKLRKKLNKHGMQLQLQHQLQLHSIHLDQNISYNHFLGGFDSSLGCLSPQTSFYHSAAGFFSQGGALNYTSEQAIDCRWSLHNTQSLVEKEEMEFCNYGWTLQDGDQATCTQPLKTLDLFPETAAGLKEDPTSCRQLPLDAL